MFSNAHLRYDISHNGGNGDWYWEVTTPEREIVARALAPTSVQARADAVIAGESCSLQPHPLWGSAGDGAELPRL